MPTTEVNAAILQITKHPRSLWAGDALRQATIHPLGQVQAPGQIKPKIRAI